MAVDVNGAPHGLCSWCGLLYQLTQAGNVIRHGAGGKCRGGGRPPGIKDPVTGSVAGSGAPQRVDAEQTAD